MAGNLEFDGKALSWRERRRQRRRELAENDGPSALVGIFLVVVFGVSGICQLAAGEWGAAVVGVGASAVVAFALIAYLRRSRA